MLLLPTIYFVQDDGGTPLATAAKCGNIEMVECMLNAGADPNLAEVIQTSIEPILEHLRAVC